MSDSWNPFDRPMPLLSCLLHEAMLVQAWKKSHSYIRTRNWYADVLELDLSAATLKAEIERWRSEYQTDGLDALKPQPMRIVPAPKAGRWIFGLDSEKRRRWQPKRKPDGDGTYEYQVLRPLAHLSIRDQTFATAAMICLADVVESAQGDCSLSTAQARARSVSSYGNRLYCEWEHSARGDQSDRARFAWGNANSYRKYYADYRAFLLRPLEVCEEVESHLQIGEELGVISFDLASFYDRIVPSLAIKALRRLCRRLSFQSDREFWLALGRIMRWKWAADNVPVAKLLRDGQRPRGLPQGLVASGFLSNAYMLEFDAAFRVAISEGPADLPFQVLDYCRYVDDMRVVVRWNTSTLDEAKLKTDCTAWIGNLLESHAPGQSCNPDKTQYVGYRDLRSRGSRAVTMELIQHQLSGPADREVLEAAAVTLDGLLQATTTQRELPDWALADDAPALAKIANVTEDVRDDTTKRFAAYRQLNTLRELRQRAAEDVGVEARLEVQRLDAAIEIAARRMIRFWVEDPSLGIVLRHGLNLMPSPELVRPVIAALRGWIGATPKTRTETIAHWICLYVASDLFKAGVVETGVDVAAEAMPAKSDLAGYRELLAEFGEWLLAPRSDVAPPWYLKQQAMLFLISLGRPLAVMRQRPDAATRDYVDLANVSQGVLDRMEDAASRIAPLLLVAHQFHGDDRLTVSRIARWLAAQEDERVAATVVEQVYLFDSDLFGELLDHTDGAREHAAWRKLLDKSFARVGRTKVGKTRLPRRRPTTLAAAIATEPNPFGHENAALRLLVALTDLLRAQKDDSLSERLSPHAVLVSCADWFRLRDPRFNEEDIALKLAVSPSELQDPRYALPEWCPADRRAFMVVGRVLRAAITGDADWTAQHMFKLPPVEGYHGIRSSWFKREHGMFHRPDALGGPQASCSPWIAELLAKLLMWPGCRETNRFIEHWSAVRTLADLRSLANERLAEQARIYARASDLPVYVHRVGVALKSPPKLTIVLVQCVRPWRDDFAKYGAQLDGSGFRTIRRGHLSSLLRVADKLLSLRSTYGRDTRADLVLLPELSVHEADMDLIRSLVDRTQAMVFCGLVFRILPGTSKLVNMARWMIPDRQQTGRSIVLIDQGKQHLTSAEKKLGVSSWRPHQVVVELEDGVGGIPYRIAGSVCLDATDLRLAADLRDITDLFVIPAHNRDVGTFDAMADALNYHMYQHVAIVNNGEFGGTVVRAPYAERHERVLTHNHGGCHAVVSIVDVDLSDYRSSPKGPSRPLKTPPAGYSRHRAVDDGESGE